MKNRQRVRRANRRSIENPNQSAGKHHSFHCCRPTALAAAMAVALAPTAALAWERNVELFAIPTSERFILGAALLQPLRQDDQSLTYADVRVLRPGAGFNEVNVGVGYRQLVSDEQWILGGWAAFDSRETARNNRFNQVSAGVEALSDQWDARFNYYYPTTDKKLVGFGTSGAIFRSTQLLTTGLIEEALQGFDAEVGTLVPFVHFGEARAFVGGYHYSGDVAPTTNGIRARFEFRPRQNINLGYVYQHDDEFGAEHLFQLRYSYGYPNRRGNRTLRQRMVQFVERDIDIKDTSQLPDSVMESNAAEHERVLTSQMVHINSATTAAAAAQDGSVENPYDSFSRCQTTGTTTRCNEVGSNVYIHAGNGTAYDTNGITLMDGQPIFGQGVLSIVAGGQTVALAPAPGLGTFPVVTTAAGDTIVLGNNNEVAGLEIMGPGNGIFGNNITQFNIHDNRITGVGGRGIQIDTRGTNATTGIISNNVIDGAAGNGVFLFVRSTDGDTTTQDIMFWGNTVRNSGSDGLTILNQVSNSDGGSVPSLATQTVTLTDSIFENNVGDGVFIENDAFHDSQAEPSFATQTVTVSNSVFRNNGDDGLDIFNDLFLDSEDNTQSVATLLQSVTIDDSVFSGNTDAGLSVRSDFDGSAADTVPYVDQTQTVDLSAGGNMTSGNGTSGVFIDNGTDFTASNPDVEQNVDLSGDNDFSDGVTVNPTSDPTQNIVLP